MTVVGADGGDFYIMDHAWIALACFRLRSAELVRWLGKSQVHGLLEKMRNNAIDVRIRMFPQVRDGIY